MCVWCIAPCTQSQTRWAPLVQTTWRGDPGWQTGEWLTAALHTLGKGKIFKHQLCSQEREKLQWNNAIIYNCLKSLLFVVLQDLVTYFSCVGTTRSSCRGATSMMFCAFFSSCGGGAVGTARVSKGAEVSARKYWTRALSKLGRAN